ncbi:MAG: [FeFe] hydrogenase H-cluster radical SAM maturase HydG [bacterium]
MKTFIDKEKITALLENANPKEASQVIKKALKLKGLTPAETAVLLNVTDKKTLASLFQAAKKAKEEIYGNRLVLFAPLYITNYCVNNCLYCGFRSDNKKLARRRLSLEEIKAQVAILEKEGHKRILLVGGEDPVAGSITFLEKAIKAIYEVKVGPGEIRRLNVNVAPLEVPDFKRLSKTGIGTYQLFQETYEPEVYKTMHPKGPKADYKYRLYGMHRAMKGGIKDVGIGVLFGLADYKYEVLAMLFHALELEKEFGVGPHTISVPRIEPAFDTPLTGNPPHPVSDEEFKKIVAILRLAVPYTGIILSTRETAKLRNEVFALGISQISAGSRTTPGGYEQNNSASEQFTLHDSRSLLEVIKDISKMGYSPSFCTACYRLGRTGKDFMDLAKPGLIKKFCLPNSLLTFKEYLEDYGDAEAKKLGEKVIKSAKLSSAFQKKLKKIENGERDLYC